MSEPPRNVFQSELYAVALKQWERSRKPDKRAMAINLSCEHRVPPEQEEEFKTFFKPPHNSRALKKALSQYVIKKVRPELPAERLSVNLVADCRSGECCEGFDCTQHLVNVLNLTRLHGALRDIVTVRDDPAWKPLHYMPMNEADYNDWLDSKLLGKSPESEEVINFIKAVFTVLNYSRDKKGPYNPTWVTTWDQFAPYAKALREGGALDVDRWNQVVGVEVMGRQWQIILKYPAKAVGKLFRPTQLDGGYYRYHFPSPAMAGMAVGGHPMDLAPTSPAPTLLPEYIHAQIELDIDYWTAAGPLIGRAEGSEYRLSRLRKQHYERLKGQYPDVCQWMSRPI